MKTHLLLLLLLLFFSSSISAFHPLDNHLINCGSTTQIRHDNRLFLPDSDAPRSSIKYSNPSSAPSDLYRTARIFTRPSSYELDITATGTHLVRLHFYPISSSSPSLNPSAAKFHVSATGYLLLTDFVVPIGVETPIVKEFLIKLEKGRVLITFTPVCGRSFAFVNAIEVISAPGDLIADVAKSVTPLGVSDFRGLSSRALELVHRVNVGGPKVTPFNDTLWRTWVPDLGFLKSAASASKPVYFSGRIQYREGGASREIAPDTARELNREAEGFKNLIWVFAVKPGHQYLVRMHFCDIVTPALNQLFFNVYVNGYSAYEDLDISEATYRLASPYYVDFVASSDEAGTLSVSVGPSKRSSPSFMNAILNGVEIMRMSDTMGCLGDPLVVRPSERGYSIFLKAVMGGIAFATLVVIVYVFAWRRGFTRDYVPWTPLPTESSDGKAWLKSSAMPGKMGSF
ncbi:putative receptor-like protein kinase [Acorus calamus]|uniref:Receptor-like protein kinase n=1 Tax=Acorus calamus TaxID=4465 RepID=A0AAV9DR52_ACOCL|nr:putative receptor-like protein kinase [Acorus calamus]